MPYGITQCYLPPGRGVNAPLPPAEAQVLDLAIPERCKSELWAMGRPYLGLTLLLFTPISAFELSR